MIQEENITMVEETTNLIKNNNGGIPPFGWLDILLIIIIIVLLLIELYRHRNDRIDTLIDWEMEKNNDESSKGNN